MARILASWTGRGRQSVDQLAHIEAQFYGMIRWPMRSIASVLGWEALFHAVAVAEVFLVLRLLPGGSATSLADAFVLETTGRLDRRRVQVRSLPPRRGRSWYCTRGTRTLARSDGRRDPCPHPAHSNPVLERDRPRLARPRQVTSEAPPQTGENRCLVALGGQWTVGRSRDDGSVGLESRAVTRTIPSHLRLIPVDLASHVRANGGPQREDAPSVT